MTDRSRDSEAIEHSDAFTHDLRRLFDMYNVDLHTLIAIMPTGHVLTVGLDQDNCKENGLDLIHASHVGPQGLRPSKKEQN